MLTNSSDILRFLCLSRTTVSIFSVVILSNTLLLPLFILVIYLGFQRWRELPSSGTASATSHSDIFTFNMVALELICVVGSLFYTYGTIVNEISLRLTGLYIFSIISPAQTLFHLLTCVERYLAVVHPITYLGLRQARGIRIRNLSIGCVWVFIFASLGVLRLSSGIVLYNFLFLVFASVVMSFCSLSTLCVLIRPGPSDERERVDQSKQRAFFTIVAIMGALLIRFLSSMVSLLVFVFLIGHLSSRPVCLMLWSVASFSLPSSLVLPLLFLHRLGKLPGCRHKAGLG